VVRSSLGEDLLKILELVAHGRYTLRAIATTGDIFQDAKGSPSVMK
jgi:hypothetical protein